MHIASPLADPAEMDAAIHAAREGIVTIDEAMRIVMVNPSALRMFGHTAQQLLGSDLSVLLPGDARQAHAAHVLHFIASGVTERSMLGRGNLKGLRANGEVFPLEATICQLETANVLEGKRFYTALLRDVSGERQLLASIEQLNRRISSLFDLLPVAVWVTEGERVVYANTVCARLFGAGQREDLVDRSIYEFLDPAVHERVRQTVNRVLADPESALPVHGRIAPPDGERREVEMVIASLPDHSRTLVQMVISDITEESRERRGLLNAQSTLRDLAASLVDAREEERRSLARELHDELGQRLTALKLELSALVQSGLQRIPGDRMQSMIDMVDDTVAATRRISMDLRPLMLDDLGLKAAIEWLAREFWLRTGVQMVLDLERVPDPLPQKVVTALYRIVQEALTNIVRHSGANRVEIAIERAGPMIELLVEDNGQGFSRLPPQSPKGSFGLIGIQERVLMLGGELSVGNRPEGGARLLVTLPLSGVVGAVQPTGARGAAGESL